MISNTHSTRRRTNQNKILGNVQEEELENKRKEKRARGHHRSKASKNQKEGRFRYNYFNLEALATLRQDGVCEVLKYLMEKNKRDFWKTFHLFAIHIARKIPIDTRTRNTCILCMM